ncbi:SRPBCC family protein [Nocardiopsis valliformis]|uniref:SRPBCC family protein n=1 Tax=Nocardiopsis valliformis TaxID=239974 RepID=UPI0003470442|nr:SRPBCC family protein [Nocardiopsis valliformis]
MLNFRYGLHPVDQTFFETAPMRWRVGLELAASPDEVWAGLTAPRPLSWCRALSDVHYTSEAPYGTDTTREATVLGTYRMHEKFFHWDEAERRKSFYADAATLPVFSSFAEDYHVLPFEGGSKLVWSFAFAPWKGLDSAMQLGTPLTETLLASLVKDTRNHFGPLTEVHRP